MKKRARFISSHCSATRTYAIGRLGNAQRCGGGGLQASDHHTNLHTELGIHKEYSGASYCPSLSVTDEYFGVTPQLLRSVRRQARLPRHIHRSGSPVAVFNDSSASIFENCIVCMDSPGDRTLWPCRHTGICAECAERLDTCPLCRSSIKARVPR